MRFPDAMKKLNKAIAFVCGSLVMIIAVLTVFEAVMRYFFHNPTSWSLNVCTYILIWYAFLGSAYSFQVHGHVGVDMFKDIIDKRTKTRCVRRIMAIAGYGMSIVYIATLLYGGYRLCAKAVQYHQMTSAVNPIPMIFLTSAVVAGCVLMLVTLVCIILDLLGKGDEYM